MAAVDFSIVFLVFCSVCYNCAAFNNVGCLFSESVCESGLEWCHNDAAFGRCLPLQTDPSDAIYRHELNEPELVALEAALEELHQSGYKWSDLVTQCVLQRLFDAFQHKTQTIPDVCYEILQDEENGGEFLDEKDPGLLDQSFEDEDNNPRIVQKRKPTFFPFTKSRIFSESGSVNQDKVGSSEEDLVDRLKEILDLEDEQREEGKPIPLFDPYDNFQDESDFRLTQMFPSSKFERQERLDVKKPGPWFSVNNFAFQKPESRLWNRKDWVPIVEEDYVYDTNEASEKFQENLEKNADENLRRMAVQKLVDRLSAEEEDPAEKSESPKGEISKPAEVKVEKVVDRSLSTPATPAASQKFDDDVQQDAQHADLVGKQYQVVDASYAYIGIKGSFKTWKESAKFVKALARILDLPPETFTDLRVEENQIVFRVLPNKKGLTASMVAKKTEEMRDEIRRVTGLEVEATGIGDQSQISTAVYGGAKNQELLLTVALCVLITTILAAAVTLYIIRRRYQAQQKLKGLAQSADSEATRDYQDLCRARMATKSPGPILESAAKDPVKMPLIATSRDSESSRSSTSSWCEEPVLTNMDISTGHMVLTYMEDHLRNKDRLDQEWQALCAYEAEPSTSTLAASKPENGSKNRFQDVLPYDHSRVILNTLGNEEGSDYINASAIADHDPRHPAYIAAQAPLPGTVVDFWQMIWEQGSVVLVLLTKTSENGQELCHVYWPQEGSQRYNYFEVHLVSEHIWCDDYLVRSFYLKNLRTGETRTVTQFHFLSWPENSVPLSTKALLEFRRKVNKSYRGRSCPIVVHCSDGAGRTGTYCLIDMVLHRMAKGAREIDIAATLEHLRDQRAKAVRTKQQFEFVLTAVAEEVHAILRALPQ